MNLLRRLLLVLLVISLPGYGWALTGMPACSMQMQKGSADAHSAHCDAQQKHTAAKAAHSTCQGDLQCQCSALYQAVQSHTALVIPSTHAVIQSSPFHLITTAALSLWRPPTVS